MTDWPRTMPALVTPFTENGDLDLDAHASNVATMVDRGARGILIGGSTGQGPYLEPGERRDLARSARAGAPDATIICGVFGESVRQAVAQVEEATDGGADAVLVATPGSLVRARPDRIDAFYRDLASAARVPILLYTVPQVTGVELPTASIVDLAAEPGIIGVKDSGGDADRFRAMRDLLDAGFATYVGASKAVLAAHANGAYGAITASANYALTEVSLAVRGDADAQRRLTGLIGVVEPHGVAGTMAAAEASGLTVGIPRSPLAAVSTEIAAEIGDALAAAGLRAAQHPGQG